MPAEERGNGSGLPRVAQPDAAQIAPTLIVLSGGFIDRLLQPLSPDASATLSTSAYC